MLRQFVLLTLASLAGRANESSRAPLHFAEVYVCFAEEHASDLVSGFGHVFVCLPEKPASRVDDLLAAPAVNFAADTSALGEGAWVGRYRLGVCHELIRNNAFFQQRDVYFIRLDMDKAARARLALSLQNRLGKPFPYNFLRQNCGVRLAEWIDSALVPGRTFSPPFFYLTPREAIESVINHVNAEGFYVYPSSASRVARRAAWLGAEATEQARRAVKDIAFTPEIADPALRLDVIRLNESRANPEEYSRLQAIKREILSGPSGPDIAREVTGAFDSGLRPMNEWIYSDEGPGLGISVLHDQVHESGIRLIWEGGLRDVFTVPVSSDTRRVARLLSLELDFFQHEIQHGFVLIGMHIDRDLPGVFGSGSSGFEIGHMGRLNASGTSGAYAETWSGVSFKFPPESWISFRLNLRVDEMFGDPRVRLLPTMCCSADFGPLRAQATIVSDLGHAGGRLEFSGDTATGVVSLGLEHEPRGGRRLDVSLFRRF